MLLMIYSLNTISYLPYFDATYYLQVMVQGWNLAFKKKT